jgi:aryl-alcohol dehydrogenase-like predicted oxidoreductase
VDAVDTIKLPNLKIANSRVGLGTWAIGGWMWGGTNEKDSVDTIITAIENGVNLIDTAPVYGFGKSEEIIGKALARHRQRERIVISTKAGIEWQGNKVFRNSSRKRIFKEIDDSLRRLKVDYVDVYHIHWPDMKTPFEETAEAMRKLLDDQKILAIGVSNYEIEYMDRFRKEAPVHVNQPPYNMFEREITETQLPYCKENDIAILAYGALCRGLLSGKMTADREFHGDDLRKIDPKFQTDKLDQYLKAVEELDQFAQKRFGKRVIHLAVRWILDNEADVALWGARRPDQLKDLEEVWDWTLSQDDLREIENIIEKHVPEPLGAEFMAPPE